MRRLLRRPRRTSPPGECRYCSRPAIVRVLMLNTWDEMCFDHFWNEMEARLQSARKRLDELAAAGKERATPAEIDRRRRRAGEAVTGLVHSIARLPERLDEK